MRKTAPWWTSAMAFILAMTIGVVSALYVNKHYPEWIVEYKLAFIIFCIIAAEIILTIIVKIIWHDCGDDCRGRYDINKIRSPYRKRK